MHKRKIMLAVAILLMTVGFAAVTTALYANGTATITTADFDVVFTEASIDGEDVSLTAIGNSGKEITYSTKQLAALGSESVLDFKIANQSSQYDSSVAVECIPYSTSADEDEVELNAANFDSYLTVSTDANSYSIDALAEKAGSVAVTLKKAYFDEAGLNITFKCSLVATAIEK